MIVVGKPAPFLKGIERILFDMDGVITSEEGYWDVAALTVYEIFNSNKYFGRQEIIPDVIQDSTREIRKKVFHNDKFIVLVKDRGVNSNWDLAYVAICGILLANIDRDVKETATKQIKKRLNDLNDKELLLDLFTILDIESVNYEKAYNYIRNLNKTALDMYPLIGKDLAGLIGMPERLFARKQVLWELCKDIFLEWYLGDELFERFYNKSPAQKGKKGFIFLEQPLLPLNNVKKTIQVLYNSGIKLGIGTGRPLSEIERPLEMWGLRKYFDDESFITYDDIIEAEKELTGTEFGNLNLIKPHPFMFLKGIFGKNYPTKSIIKGIYNREEIAKTLIVGDAGADIIAAQNINCKFAAVLTGYGGKRAKKFFQQQGADIIIDSVCDLVTEDIV